MQFFLRLTAGQLVMTALLIAACALGGCDEARPTAQPTPTQPGADAATTPDGAPQASGDAQAALRPRRDTASATPAHGYDDQTGPLFEFEHRMSDAQSRSPFAEPPRPEGFASLPPLWREAADVVDVIAKAQGQGGTLDWAAIQRLRMQAAGIGFDPWAQIVFIEARKTLAVMLWESAMRRERFQDACAAIAERAVTVEAADDKALARLRGLTAEHWRVLLSVMTDSIAHDGLFDGAHVPLTPLAPQVREALVRAVGDLDILLLTETAAAARANQHPTITIGDVQGAMSRLVDDFQLRDSYVAGGAAAIEAHPAATAYLQWLGRYYIRSRLIARGQSESIGVQNTRTLKALNTLSSVPFTEAGFALWLEQVLPMARFTALGLTPRRLDVDPQVIAFLRDVVFEPGMNLRRDERQRAYVTATFMANAIEQLFPAGVNDNGSVTVQWSANLSPHGGGAAGIEQVISGRELDALRNSGAHWRLVDWAWHGRDTVTADPFAIELQAERLACMGAFYAKLLEHLARHDAASEIAPQAVDIRPIQTLGFLPVYRPDLPWRDDDRIEKVKLAEGYRAPFFKDITATANISRQVHVLDESPLEAQINFDIREYMGSGVAVGDYDGDGLVDLFLGGSAGNRLYRNVGGHRFEDVTAMVGIRDDQVRDTHHCLFADVDNDGLLDLLILHGEGEARLFLQRDDHQFVDVSDASGIHVNTGAHNAFFFDYDNDGLLDLHIGHYGADADSGMDFPSIDARNGNANQLYRNEGHGVFRDVTHEAGVGSTAWTLAGAAIDYDEDGLMDFYLANDWGPDQMYRNRGDGTFEDVSDAINANDHGSGMNVSLTDVNGDGRWDIYVSVIDTFRLNTQLYLPRARTGGTLGERISAARIDLSGNKLLVMSDDGRYRSVEHERFEPARKGWAWAGLFFDYDNDGDEDFYITNGWIERAKAHHNQRNRFFLRDGERFHLLDTESDESFAGNSRGAAAVDFAGDGRMDLVVNNYGAAPRLLRNTREDEQRWLKVRLVGTRANRFGVGATVRVFVDERMSMRMVSAGSGYLAQQDTTLTFGLGDALTASRIEVRWPDGTMQAEDGPFDAGRLITITER